MEFKFRPDREAHLKMLCAEMGRSVDDFVNEAVLRFMEDYEDGRDAHEALKEFHAGNESTISMEEMMREYGLEAGDLSEGTEADVSAGSGSPDSDHQFSRVETTKAA